jgi:imidazolonepropionase-like amidohydrolase
MAPEAPSRAVRAGVDSIEHGLYLTPADLDQLGSRGGAWVPTIANTEDVLSTFSTGSTAARVLGEGIEKLRTTLPLAAEAGVAVLAGTDLGLRHGEVASEAVRLAEHGLTSPEAVNAASTNAYRYLGVATFAANSSADIVLFDADPTVSLEVLAVPVAGMRAGRVVFDHLRVFPESDRDLSPKVV